MSHQVLLLALCTAGKWTGPRGDDFLLELVLTLRVFVDRPQLVGRDSEEIELTCWSASSESGDPKFAPGRIQ